MSAPSLLADVVCRTVSCGGTEEDELQQVKVNVLFGAAEVPELVAKRVAGVGVAGAAGDSLRVFPSKEGAHETGAVGAPLRQLCDSLTRDREAAARLLLAGGYAFEDNGRSVVLWIREGAELRAGQSTGTNVIAARRTRKSTTGSVRTARLSVSNKDLLHTALSPLLPRDGRGVVLPLSLCGKRFGDENAPPNPAGPTALSVIPPWEWSHASAQFESIGLGPNPDLSAADLIGKAKR